MNNFPLNILYYGKEEPLAEQVSLRAGPLEMVFEAGDVRYVRLGSHEILRRVYVAVRDSHWGTVAPRISNLRMEIREDHFRIDYEVENRQDEIDFFWRGEIVGEPDGTLRLRMDGVARSTFLKNRIGFCVLHPATLAGAAYLVEHTNGAQEQAALPTWVNSDQPVQPFYDMGAMSHEVIPGLWAEVRYEGDQFEVEDQRNWTDASFKAYCTPLALPFPVRVAEGARICQAVTLTLKGRASKQSYGEIARRDEALRLTISSDEQSIPLPPIGLSLPANLDELTGIELARLKALNLGHLRVELDLFEAGYPERLGFAWRQAQALDLPLEVALRIAPGRAEPVRELRRWLDELRPRLRRWLVYPEQESARLPSPIREVVELARQNLGELRLANSVRTHDYGAGVEWGAGTNLHYILLQRNLPPLTLLDSMAFAITGEVHAFDNTSLVETLETQGQVLRSALHLGKGKPVVVSPITFKKRLLTPGSAPSRQPVELPAEVDVRQMSLFGAAWTLGSVKYLGENGAHSLTYFETVGWKGVMETVEGAALPELFHSIPGGVYPMYHVLASIGDFAGGQIIPCRSSDPLRIEGLALRKGNARRLLLANMTAEPQTVRVERAGAVKTLKHLDETNALEVLQAPEAFRQRPGLPAGAAAGGLTVELKPYALVWMDGADSSALSTG